MQPSDEAIRKALAAVDVADLDDQIERSSPALGSGREALSHTRGREAGGSDR